MTVVCDSHHYQPKVRKRKAAKMTASSGARIGACAVAVVLSSAVARASCPLIDPSESMKKAVVVFAGTVTDVRSLTDCTLSRP
jgi:hypothetical protein